MNREAWLAERRTGIGSSDAPAVCGLSPWATALDVWLDKIGQRPDTEPTPAMEWGLRLESVIAAAYCERNPGTELAIPRLLRHAEFEWMLCNADRVSDEGRIVELKTCSAFAADEWGEPGTDQVPEAYLVQVMHQMAVYRSHGEPIDAADIAVLIGGSDFRTYSVPWNEQLAGILLDRERAFWDRVILRDPPPPDWEHRHTPELIAAMYTPGEATVTLDSDALELAREYARLGAEKSAAEKAREVVKAKLIERMGSAGTALLPDGSKIVRKAVERSGYTVEPSTYFSFTVKAPKGER